MNSRQFTRWFKPKLTAMLRTVSNAIGKSQLGFLTTSSKVFWGENRTPKTRLIAFIRGDGSGASGETAVLVAMGISSTTKFRCTRCKNNTQERNERFQWADSSLVRRDCQEGALRGRSNLPRPSGKHRLNAPALPGQLPAIPGCKRRSAGAGSAP